MGSGVMIFSSANVHVPFEIFIAKELVCSFLAKSNEHRVCISVDIHHQKVPAAVSTGHFLDRYTVCPEHQLAMNVVQNEKVLVSCRGRDIKRSAGAPSAVPSMVGVESEKAHSPITGRHEACDIARPWCTRSLLLRKPK
jgi:hypothetical protein